MKTANIVTQSLRHSETGQCWEEVLTNEMGTIEVHKQTAFRVRATGATTVTVDGVLAMTMAEGEIAVFNAGDGDPDAGNRLVAIVIAGAPAYVQVARETYRVRLTT